MWGKSYLPLTRAVMPVVVTPLAFVLIVGLAFAVPSKKGHQA